MKKTLSLSLVSLLLALAAPAVRAQGPEQISYQGRLTNSAGMAIGATTPENRRVVFRIWNHATNTNPASRLWTEEHTVTVFQGDFSVILGSGLQYQAEARPVLSTILNGPERYVEISVEDGASFQAISPRQQITSTAFALRANVAQSVNQNSGMSYFSSTNTNGTAFMNGNLIMNGENQVFLGGGAGDANGALYSNAGAVGLYGRGPTDAQRKLVVEAKGGTTFSGPINFNTPNGGLGQLINLWSDTYGLGISPGTLYYRAGGGHRWYLGGSSGGGGTDAAHLDGGGFTLSTGNFNGNLNGTVYGTLDRGGYGHGVFAQSYGGGHSFGSQDWTTFSRSARNFAWYLGGNFTTNELNNGGGTTIAQLNGDGLFVGGNTLRLGWNRTGQEASAGSISYAVHTPGTLDIVGAGTDGWTRKVKVWAEGGTIFSGGITAGHNYYEYSAYAYFARQNNGQPLVSWITGSGGSSPYSFVGTGRVACTELNITSDARIKKVVGHSDSGKDLATLLKVQVTDYTKVEDMSPKPRAYKKVIAQQIEEIFPQAVSKMPGTVPDIFAKFTAKAGLISVKAPQKMEVKAGDVIKAFPEKPDPNKPELLLTVKEVTKDGVRVTEPVDGNLFVFGRQVSDLRTVDYEAIAMLNVSATQELHRTIEAQAAELKKLREENDALEKELGAARDANRQQDTRLAAIEKALQAGSGGQSTIGSAAPKLKPARSK